MHISCLHVENFQNHRNTRLAFSPGLNVIVGEAEQGKSALIRALGWLFFNHPPGADFRRAGSYWCRVSALLDDGAMVARERHGGDLTYILRLPGQAPLTVPDDGMSIPPAVLAAHGMRPLALGHGRTVNPNLADQFSPPFLVEGDVSQRAAAFGRLRGAHLAAAAARLGNESREEQARLASLLLEKLAAAIRKQTYATVERIVNLALETVFGVGYSFRIHSDGSEGETTVLFALATPYGALCDGEPLARAHGGGLVDLVGLALRLSMLVVARPPLPGPLILDEPARHLSDQYISDLARFLKLVTQDLHRQVIVATHDQHLTGAADTVFVLADEGGVAAPHPRGKCHRAPLKPLDPQ
ncbi:MAG: AAA family ATPase [Bacillota bacterium]|nr:AAA family ATPase [Bacillota bacterium]